MRALFVPLAALVLLVPLGACTPDSGAEASPSSFAGPPLDTGAELSWEGPGLALPLDEPERYDTVLGVDHDPVVQEPGIGELTCTDFAGRGFPNCYDEHDGTDYLLRGGFDAMDMGSSRVLAAAPGTVTLTEDFNYDRCHGDLGTGDIDCDGHEMRANKVEITHEGGWVSRYLHLMAWSVVVEEGQEVEAGEMLGFVGSSGNSFTPHLHLEIWSPQGEVVDPYAGPESQDWTLWCDQGDEDDLPGGC